MFRIGVHLGEVIVDEENHDIFGDGVNLAERIQGLAEPGGIAVSRAVRDVTELQVDVRLRRWRRAPGQECQPAPSHLPCARARRRLDADHARPSCRRRRCASTAPTWRVANSASNCHSTGWRKAGRLRDRPRFRPMRRRCCRIRRCRGAMRGWSSPTTSCRSRTWARPTARRSTALAVDAGALRPLQAGAKLRIGDIELAVRYS